jgi:hypothetical protein
MSKLAIILDQQKVSPSPRNSWRGKEILPQRSATNRCIKSSINIVSFPRISERKKASRVKNDSPRCQTNFPLKYRRQIFQSIPTDLRLPTEIIPRIAHSISDVYPSYTQECLPYFLPRPFSYTCN